MKNLPWIGLILTLMFVMLVVNNLEFDTEEVDVLPIHTSTVEPTPTATLEPTPEPTATPTPVPTPTPLPQTFIATRYGVSYNGQNMGCIGAGPYISEDPTILAAPPARYAEWPCGTILSVCYQDRCQEVIRKDSCPGCDANHIDLSEAGLWYLCRDTCGTLSGITVTVLYRPQAVVVQPALIEEFIVEQCEHLLAPREQRDVCIVGALTRSPAP